MILLPETIWERLLQEFRWPRKRVERVAYLDGVIGEKDSTVTTLVFPDARLEKTHFTVSAEAMSQCGSHFRKFGLSRIAQVHTHPSTWVGHSIYDDEMAYSLHEGAISLVMPEHAKKRPGLHACGIHLRTNARWRQLAKEEIDALFVLVPGLLDFRRRR